MGYTGYERVARTIEMPFDPRSITKEDAATYVEAMCDELGQLCEATGLGFLAHLLEVAREEALFHCAPRPPKVLHGELPPR